MLDIFSKMGWLHVLRSVVKMAKEDQIAGVGVVVVVDVVVAVLYDKQHCLRFDDAVYVVWLELMDRVEQK